MVGPGSVWIPGRAVTARCGLVLTTLAIALVIALPTVPIDARGSAAIPYAVPAVAGQPHASGAPSPLPLRADRSPTVPSAPLQLPHVHGVRLSDGIRFPGLLGRAADPPGVSFAVTALGGGPNATDWQNRFCNGLWPSTWGGGSLYVGDCYGHDEPGLQFYSDRSGSGGNVTWNVTLPLGASSTANQSDLYVATWFGLTLTAPFAWMHQCFLELQFYPDASWYAGTSVEPNWTQNNNWVGAAVAWQINATTGYEDACFYEPLYAGGIPSPAVLNMTGGDRIEVGMSGFPGSSVGELVTVTDLTRGARSSVTLADRGARVPLDPAYGTSAYENALQWTPGGEYPVVFAFETGHPGNPSFPDNGSSGGCDPGPPPAGPSDWAVPCPSYDPGAWVNDTAAPWHIDPPTFGAGASGTRPAVAAFSQDLGGIDLIDIQNGSHWRCGDRIGASYCSYPWYSYSCGFATFEFGATDWAETSADFGQYREYRTAATSNALQLGYYPTANVSIPTCGGASAATLVGTSAAAPGGSVYFLDRSLVTPVNWSDLAPGAYPVHAEPIPGRAFAGWVTAGSARVERASSPWTTAELTGPGSLLATFTDAPSLTELRFQPTPTVAGGGVGLADGIALVGNGSGTRALGWGSPIDLPVGRYTVEAYPPPGLRFVDFQPPAAGVELAAPGFPVTWIDIDGTSAFVNLTVQMRFVGEQASLTYGAWGPGSVQWPGGSAGNFTGPIGAYNVSAVPAPGATFVGWVAYGSDEMINFSSTTMVVLETGSSWLYAEFTRSVRVDLVVQPATAGTIAFDGVPEANGTELTTLWHQYDAIDAVPAANETFAGWSVNLSAAGYVLYASSAIGAYLYSNDSITLTVRFVPAGSFAIAVDVGGSGSGTVAIDYGPAFGSSRTVLLTAGSHRVVTGAGAGSAFVGWASTVGVNATGQFLTVSGTGTLWANFSVRTYAVTVLATPPSANLTFTVDGYAGPAGATVWLAVGTHHISLALPGGGYLLRWTASPGLGLLGNGSALTLAVGGPGTLVALLTDFTVGPVVASPGEVEVGDAVNLSVSTAGPGPFRILWSGLPPGCSSTNLSFACRPASPGTYSVAADLTAGGVVQSAAAVPLVVDTVLLLAGFTVDPAPLEVGLPLTLRVNVAGGAGPYTFAYTGLPAGCPSPDAPVVRCVLSNAGPASVHVSVEDRLGHVDSAQVSYTAAAAVAIASASLTPSVSVVGHPIRLTVQPVLGIGPYTIQVVGLPTGCVGANRTELNCTPQTAGTFPLVVLVRDSAGVGANASLTLTVVAALAIVAFAVVPASVRAGEPVQLWANATGGAPPLSFAYLGLPSNCVSANASTLSCVPGPAGAYTVTVEVTDGVGERATANATFTVEPAAGAAPANPWASVLLGVGLAALALLAAVLLLRGRTGGREKAGTPPSSTAPSSSTTRTDPPASPRGEPPVP